MQVKNIHASFPHNLCMESTCFVITNIIKKPEPSHIKSGDTEFSVHLLPNVISIMIYFKYSRSGKHAVR